MDTAVDSSTTHGTRDERAERLIVNPYVTMIQCTDDEVLVRHGSRSRYSRVLRDEERRRLLGPTLTAFRRGATVAEVRTQTGDHPDLEALVERLLEEDLLVAEDAHLPTVYARLHEGRDAVDLQTARVGVVGLGAIGGQVARQLAAMGLAAVTAVDDRSATKRDVPFLQATLGEARAGTSLAEGFSAWAKTTGMANAVASTSPPDDDTIAGLLAEHDVVVVALETFHPALLHRVNLAAIDAERPWLPVYADGSEAIIGPLVIPGRSACYNEFEIQHEASRMLRKEYLLFQEELARHDSQGLHHLIPPYAGLAASWAVTGLLPFLVTGRSFLVNTALRVDLERVEVIKEQVLRLPRCPACSDLRPGFRHPFL